tara:strand:+ start:121 stop:816 length:696 start_codon:yes stop_codon:yes gene_type:complete
MYSFEGYNSDGLGVAAAPVAVIGTAVANVGVTAYHAAKISKLQKGFQEKLENDQQKINYIKYVLARMESIAMRLGSNGVYRPGTPEFENALKQTLKSDMNYRGNCNADIYWPLKKGETPGKPRQVWATIDRTGYIKPGAQVPPDVGPIWATGCKNAIDAGAQEYIKRFKGERKHQHFKIFKEDLGTMDVFLRAATGIFMVIMLVIVTKVQRAVLREQAPPKIKKRKKKPIK